MNVQKVMESDPTTTAAAATTTTMMSLGPSTETAAMLNDMALTKRSVATQTENTTFLSLSPTISPVHFDPLTTFSISNAPTTTSSSNSNINNNNAPNPLSVSPN